jgi:hypothetical protein
MQGLLGGAAPQEQVPQEQAPQGKPSGKGSQGQYDMAAGQMIQWIVSPEGEKAVLHALGADLQQGMATILGRLLTMVNQGAIMSGKKLAPDVLFQAAAETAKALAAMAIKNQLAPQGDIGPLTKDAFYDGLAIFAQEAQGEALTPEDRQVYVAMMQKVEDMEAKGQMGGGQPQQTEGQMA